MVTQIRAGAFMTENGMNVLIHGSSCREGVV
jgi:hypothetical protein